MKNLIDLRKLEKKIEVGVETEIPDEIQIREEIDQEREIETLGEVEMMNVIEKKKGQKKGPEKDQGTGIVGIGIVLGIEEEINPGKEKETQVAAAGKKKVVTAVGCLSKNHSGRLVSLDYGLWLD